MENANTDIQLVRQNITEKLVSLQKDLESKNLTKKDLETRFRVGELEEKSYYSNAAKVIRDIERINDAISECESLLKANTANDAGGYIDMPVVKQSRSSSSPVMPEILQDLTVDDFKSFNNFSEVELIGRKKIAIIGAGAMAVGVFLPWASVFGYSISPFQGTGIIYLILAIIGIAGVFMKNDKAGNVTLAIVGVLGILLNIGSLFGYERMFLSIGYYVYLLGSIAITYVGISNLKEGYL